MVNHNSMSGRNQHHVWKHMQMGFCDEARKGEIVWVYRKDGRVFDTNPRNHGAEKDFYEESGNNESADDVITDFETKYAPLVNRLRSGRPLSENIVDIPSLIAHLEVRSRFLRESLALVATELIDEMINRFLKPDHLSRAMVSQLRENPNWVRENLDGQKLSDAEVKVITDFLDVNAGSAIERGLPSIIGPMAAVFASMRASIKTTTIKSHLESIRTSSASPIERARFYGGLEFRVHDFMSGDLILPDTCVMFVTKAGLKPCVLKDDKIDAVVLPISKSRVVIGSLNAPFNRDLKTLNSMLATVSFETFVGGSREARLEKLTRKIGQNAALHSEHEVKKIIRDALK